MRTVIAILVLAFVGAWAVLMLATVQNPETQEITLKPWALKAVAWIRRRRK